MMIHPKTLKIKIILASLFAILLIAGVFALKIKNKKNSEPLNKNVEINANNNANTAEVKTDTIIEETKNGNENISYIFNGDEIDANVFSELQKYAADKNIEIKFNNNYAFGVFIESIDGIKNGDDGKYWQYYIDGVLGDAAADKKVLKKGERVEWRFERVPF